MLMRRGDAEGASAAAAQARRVGPLTVATAGRVGLMRFNLDGRLDPAELLAEADSAWQPLAARRLTLAAAAALRAGRFRDAVAVARHAWASVPTLAIVLPCPSAEGVDAAVGAGLPDLALAWSDSVMARLTRLAVFTAPAPIGRIHTLLDLGRTGEAERLLGPIERVEAGNGSYFVVLARCRVLAARGRADEALERLARAPAPDPMPMSWGSGRLNRARLRLAAGRWGEALGDLDTLLRVPIVLPHDAVRLRFWRAEALARLGRDAEAREAYREFLSLWNNADPGVREVAAARTALARLGRGAPPTPATR
jgi:tetratricopeptide (TPR) repeat protein